jgi:hypothetical protein
MSSSNSRAVDRIIGIGAAVIGGIALYVAKNYGMDWYLQCKRLIKDLSHNSSNRSHSRRPPELGQDTSLHLHRGSCHCERIRFRVHAPRVLVALQYPSKINFNRIVIPCQHFETLTDESTYSMYAVKNGDAIGVHTFCSYCGVHVLYSPTTDPTEIHINVDCIEAGTIEKVHVEKQAAVDTYACPMTYEAAKPFNRRGSGAFPTLSTLSTLMHFQPGSHAYVFAGSNAEEEFNAYRGDGTSAAATATPTTAATAANAVPFEALHELFSPTASAGVTPITSSGTSKGTPDMSNSQQVFSTGTSKGYGKPGTSPVNGVSFHSTGIANDPMDVARSEGLNLYIGSTGGSSASPTRSPMPSGATSARSSPARGSHKVGFSNLSPGRDPPNINANLTPSTARSQGSDDTEMFHMDDSAVGRLGTHRKSEHSGSSRGATPMSHHDLESYEHFMSSPGDRAVDDTGFVYEEDHVQPSSYWSPLNEEALASHEVRYVTDSRRASRNKRSRYTQKRSMSSPPYLANRGGRRDMHDGLNGRSERDDMELDGEEVTLRNHNDEEDQSADSPNALLYQRLQQFLTK